MLVGEGSLIEAGAPYSINPAGTDLIATMPCVLSLSCFRVGRELILLALRFSDGTVVAYDAGDSAFPVSTSGRERGADSLLRAE